MRPALTPLLAIALISACGSDEHGSAVDVSVVSGVWTVTVADRSSACDGVDTGGTYYFEVPKSLPQTGSTAYVNGTWGSDTAGQVDSLTGNVDLSTGTVFFRLWKTTLVSGAQLDGTLTHTGEFTGTLTDPAPGYQPIFVTTTCVFPATAAIAPAAP